MSIKGGETRSSSEGGSKNGTTTRASTSSLFPYDEVLVPHTSRRLSPIYSRMTDLAINRTAADGVTTSSLLPSVDTSVPHSSLRLSPILSRKRDVTINRTADTKRANKLKKENGEN